MSSLPMRRVPATVAPVSTASAVAPSSPRLRYQASGATTSATVRPTTPSASRR